MTGITRAYDATIEEVNAADMSLVARINTASVDRYNTVIDPKGAKFRNWEALGKPVLWEHGKDPRRFTDPIATSLWIRTNGGQRPTEIRAKPVFLKDDFARQRWEWYRDGIVKGWSVNVLPQGNASPPSKEELRSRPDWEGASLVYRDWDLAEFSGTVIPGNAEALTADRAGLLLDLVQRNLLWLPDDVRPILEERAITHVQPEVIAPPAELVEVARYIRKKGDEFIVYSEAGKVLGKHASKEGAESQLAAIEAHKHDEEGARTYSSRFIQSDGHQRWTIHEPTGEPIEGCDFDSCSLAERCLEAMSSPVEWAAIHGAMAVHQERRNQEITADVQAMLDLVIRGKV